MKIHCVVIPCHASEAAERELNGFLGGHRIIAVDRQLVIDGQQSFWAICVSYVESAQRALPQSDQRIDYRQVLPEAEFQVFSKLRELRKALAEKEGVPPYGVFTNEQLAFAAHLSKSDRVLRGGAWNSNARNCRAAYRNDWHPDNANRNVGFRLARAHERSISLAPDPTDSASARASLSPHAAKTARAGVLVGPADAVAKARRRVFLPARSRA